MSEITPQNDTPTETKPKKVKAPKNSAMAKATAPKAKAPKAEKAAKPPKTESPKREKAPTEQLCTFAIRLRPAERDEIHAAAGPRNATRFVTAVALAAARNDDAAYREAIETARKLR